MSILVKNIKSLVGIDDGNRKKVSGMEMSRLKSIEDAYLILKNDCIHSFGLMKDLKMDSLSIDKEIDATGKFVLPSFCDSHTHLVFAASREQEFVDRINGLSYQQVAERGGGILNSAKKLREASEEELFESTWKRLGEIMMLGTGAVEIKSGYGLNTESELKMLRVIKRLKEKHPLTIKSTLLGAHAIPVEFKNDKAGYINLIIDEMMPRIAAEKLADYCDVFCEHGYFTKDETKKILDVGQRYGMKPKVHAEQLSNSGGIQAGVECNAISVDHLEYCSDNDISALKNSATMPTILPGAQYFLQLQHPPVRKMIDAGLPVAIASDYNPGSSPSGNMMQMVSLACIQYKMTPEEAFNATTLNSAYAMEVSDTHGSIAIGKKANVLITKEIPSLAYLPYSFGSNLIETIILNGEIINAQ
ncbi:MAG: imidazolonepropionase [Bacteroidota bacterium]